MTRVFSKRLVIDASVLCAAGTTDHPTSRVCREFLEEVRRICHRIVICDDLRVEYRNHSSRFASGWRTEMQSRGKVESISVDTSSIQELSGLLGPSGRDLNDVKKDAHLIAAALITDHIVVSLEKRARRDYGLIAKQERSIQAIVWTNPVEDQGALKWLQEGAPTECEYRLGAE